MPTKLTRRDLLGAAPGVLASPMGSDISADMFEVRTAYSLDKKTPKPIEYDASQRKRLFDLYSGTINGVVYGVGNGNETQSLSAYLREENASVIEHPVHEEILTQIPSYTVDTLHQKELRKADPKTTISPKQKRLLSMFCLTQTMAVLTQRHVI